MRSAGQVRDRSWVPAVAVAVVVVLAGVRLISLSARAHAAELRSAAQSAVSRHAHGVEAQLQALLERTRAEARRAGGTAAEPGRNAFWMTDAGALLSTGDADSAISRALAGEWVAALGGGREAGGVFGPVRYGSQWLIAAEAPAAVELPPDSGARSDGARAFLYESLEQVLLQAGFARLAQERFDFELYQGSPFSSEPRVLMSSRNEALDAPVNAAINAPGAVPSGAAPYLALAIRPYGGWYPLGPLAAEVALLALLAWALSSGAHDLAHNVIHSLRLLAMARGRLRSAHTRLAEEIEQHEALQSSLEHARYQDAATGLPNRRYFLSQVDRALRDLHARRLQRLAIILIEIDRYGFINDTLGPTAADELLLQAAQRFGAALEGTGYTLARWSSDQCAALLCDVGSPEAVRGIASTLQQARREPFALRRHRVKVAARMGFTCIERGLRRPEDALREADVALSAARRQSGLPVVQYTASMGKEAQSLVDLEADLHLALERGEFGLLFQPIFALPGLHVAGVEALLRWHHPIEGTLTPERFMSLAEEVGVLLPVTRWVIERCCRLIATWRQSLGATGDFYISVNLSAAALRDAGLLEHVARVLEATHVPPGYLKFEVAERVLAEDVSAARTLLKSLHDSGIGLMLDDFGSGYSPLSHVQLLPFDYVKIDRPFADRTGSERSNNAITAAILQMTSSLGLRTIAEAVETEEEAQALAKLGCNFGQGFFLSAPLEAAETLELLHRSPAPSTNVEPLPGAAAAATTRTAGEPTVSLTWDDTPTLVLEDTPTLTLPDVPVLP